MATILNATFDGVADVNRLAGQSDVSFDAGFMGYYSVYHPTVGDYFLANVDLTGSDWTVAAMRFGADFNNKTVLQDLDAGTGRRIDLLKLGQNSDVDLISTQVRYMYGGDGQKHDVTLGSSDTVSVDLYAAVNLVTTGSGFVGSIVTGGNDTINIGSGGARSVAAGDGRNTITVAGSTLESLSTGDGNDTVTVSGDGQINVYTDNGGINTVVLEDTSRMSSLDLDFGTNTVTTADGLLESFTSFDSSNSITIGDGGVGQMFFTAETDQSHSVTATGWIGSLQVFDDQTTTVTLGDGGAGTIRLSGGDDRVTTNDGGVELISMGGGRDTVNLGSGGANTVRLGDGNDTIRLQEIDATDTVVIQGGTGDDTVSFLAFELGVTFSLDGSGVIQNVGVPGGDLFLPAVGYFSETSIENIVGTNYDDILTGDDGANLLMGLGDDDEIDGGRGNDTLNGGTGSDIIMGGDGNDTLIGGGGVDTMIGGAGDDVMRGGAGVDTFVFGASSGTDTVEAFVRGTDILQIADHSGGFGTLVIADSGLDLSVTYDGGEILLAGRAGGLLTGSDFDFI